MRLDWYATAGYGVAQPSPEEEVYKLGCMDRVLVLVENEAELELATALQLMYGSEINVKVWDKTGITELRNQWFMIYTTWDPFDPNRF